MALVTGGASGLGRATVERFVQNGTKVVLCDMKGEELANDNKNIIFVPTDVTSETDVANALNIATTKFGQLNIIVNCAGITLASRMYNPGFKAVHKLDDFIRVLTVNHNINIE